MSGAQSIYWNDFAHTFLPARGAAKALLIAYAMRARSSGDRLGEAWPANATLEAETSYSRRAIQLARRALVNMGVLEVVGLVPHGEPYAGNVIVRLRPPALWGRKAKSPAPLFLGDGVQKCSSVHKQASEGRKRSTQTLPNKTLQKHPPNPQPRAEGGAAGGDEAGKDQQGCDVERAADAYRDMAAAQGWPSLERAPTRKLRRTLKECGDAEAWADGLRRAAASDFWRGVIGKGGVYAAMRNMLQILNTLPPAPSEPEKREVGGASERTTTAAPSGQPWLSFPYKERDAWLSRVGLEESAAYAADARALGLNPAAQVGKDAAHFKLYCAWRKRQSVEIADDAPPSGLSRVENPAAGTGTGQQLARMAAISKRF